LNGGTEKNHENEIVENPAEIPTRHITIHEPAQLMNIEECVNE
jgi:hypothetical protein